MGLFGPPNVRKLKEKGNVKGLIKALGYKKDVKVRRDAARALNEIKDNRAVKPLITALEDEDAEVRRQSASALASIGEPAVAPLIAALKNRNSKLREAAVSLLGQIGDPRARQAFMAALQDVDSSVRSAAAFRLGQMRWEPGQDEAAAWYWMIKKEWEKCAALGPLAVEALITGLSTGNYPAANALGQVGDRRAVEPLIAALRDKNTYMRSAAADGLGLLGDARAVEPLIALLKDENDRVRQSAVKALGQIGEPAVSPLITALGKGYTNIVTGAAAALGLTGDPRAVEPLIATITTHISTKSVVHIAAVKALGQIGDPRAVEPLISAIISETKKVHEDAVSALVQIGAAGVEPVMALLKDDERYARASAAMALGKIGDPRAVETLVTALRDSDPLVCRYAADALDRLGWKPDRDRIGAVYWITKGDYKQCAAVGAEGVESLIAFLEKQGGDAVPSSAVFALANTGEPRVVGPLVALLNTKNVFVRNSAVQALGQIGELAFAPLIAALKDSDDIVRKAAVEALGIIGSQDAVGELIALLGDENAPVREQTVETLGQIGDARAVEPLIAALADREGEVRKAAAGTLSKLGDPRVIEPLIAALNDKELDVREYAASGLVMMYKTAGFDEGFKKAILAQADQISKLDRARHEEHTDCTWGGCWNDAYHNDNTVVDPGFHADFAL